MAVSTETLAGSGCAFPLDFLEKTNKDGERIHLPSLTFSTPNDTMKIRYNAPVSLSFSLLCLLVYMLGSVVPPLRYLFMLPGAGSFSLAQPLDWLRLITHAIGHASWDHLFGNLSFILLLGPILEEKHGSARLLFMILVTALVTGIVNVMFFSTGLLGASGIVFMMILLVSITNIRSGEIPLSFVLVLLVYLLRELLLGLSADQVAHSAHLIGGACGSLFGFGLATKKAGRYT